MVFIGEGDIVLASALFFIGNIGVSGRWCSTTRCCRTSRSRGNRSRLVGGLRDGLRQRRRAAADQPGVDPAAATFGFAGTASAIRASFVSVAVWWAVFSIPLFRKVPEPRGRRTAAAASAIGAAFTRLGTNVQRDPPLSPRVPVVHRDAALPGRHPDHHPHGRRLRRRGRHRSDVADRRVRDGAVPRHPVRVPVRLARRAHRHQALHLHRDRRLRRWPRSSPTS